MLFDNPATHPPLLTTTSMDIEYFILDPQTGHGIGFVSNVDETEQGLFGSVTYFDDEGPGTYQWLGSLSLLKGEDVSEEFRQTAAYSMVNQLDR